MNKHRFKIGDWVEWTHQCEFVTSASKRTIKRRQPHSWENSHGQIVGIALRHEGTIEGGVYNYSGPSNMDVDIEPNYLASTKQHYLWLVKKGMMNKEILVLDEDTRPAWEGLPLVMLLKDPGRLNIAAKEAASHEMKKIMKDWPRDGNGRWMKEGAEHA